MDKDHLCEFEELCEKCHPEAEMQAKRKTCTDKNCRKCGIYWEFHDGYFGLDEE